MIAPRRARVKRLLRVGATAPVAPRSLSRHAVGVRNLIKLALRFPFMLARWLVESRLACLLLVFVLFAWFAPHPFTSNHEARIRSAGLILQLVGIGTVVYGIRRTRNLLRQPFRERALLIYRKELPAVFRSRR